MCLRYVTVLASGENGSEMGHHDGIGQEVRYILSMYDCQDKIPEHPSKKIGRKRLLLLAFGMKKVSLTCVLSGLMP